MLVLSFSPIQISILGLFHRWHSDRNEYCKYCMNSAAWLLLLTSDTSSVSVLVWPLTRLADAMLSDVSVNSPVDIKGVAVSCFLISSTGGKTIMSTNNSVQHERVYRITSVWAEQKPVDLKEPVWPLAYEANSSFAGLPSHPHFWLLSWKLITSFLSLYLYMAV